MSKKKLATKNVKKIPNCAAAPKSISHGFLSRGPKSIIAPIPINSKSGNNSFAIPALNRTSMGPSSAPGWVIAPDHGRFTKIVPKPMGSNNVGSISFAIAK